MANHQNLIYFLNYVIINIIDNFYFFVFFKFIYCILIKTGWLDKNI
jgi:hypothetical protein